MKRTLFFLGIAIASCWPIIAKGPADHASDETEIRAGIEAYVTAYNRGDAKAIAEQWSDSGEWIGPSGQRVQGRAAIEKELAAMFAEGKGMSIEVLDMSIRFVTSNVALVEGKVRVTQPGHASSTSTFIATKVKEGGVWRVDSVRETDVPDAPATDTPLNELEWLVGDWVAPQSPDTVVAHVAWTKNNSFLSYSFKAPAMPGTDELEGTQVIGWDPAIGAIRSWMFDSDGGFGEGTWSKRGNRWIIKFKQTLPDGRKASAENIYTLSDKGSVTWQSIGRQVDGKFMPNIGPLEVVRKAATQPATAKK